MKNKQKNGKKSYLYIIFLALAFIILLGTGAYAYYQTTITGTITGNVAKWSFKANNQTSTLSIDFGDLYPGKTSEHAIELSAKDSDLPVVFELLFHCPEVFTASYGFNSRGIYELEFFFNRIYFDNEYTLRAGFYGHEIAGFKGLIMPGETATIPVYFHWSYEENVIVDGMVIQPGTLVNENPVLNLPITIIGRQLPQGNLNEIYDIALESDLLGLTDLSNCSNGTYAYPNKYGYPCGFSSFNIDSSNRLFDNFIVPIHQQFIFD